MNNFSREKRGGSPTCATGSGLSTRLSRKSGGSPYHCIVKTRNPLRYISKTVERAFDRANPERTASTDPSHRDYFPEFDRLGNQLGNIEEKLEDQHQEQASGNMETIAYARIESDLVGGE